MNQYLYNASYAGTQGYNAFNTLFRKQWLGIEGAPQYSLLSYHTPLSNKKLALGGMAYNEVIGPLNNTELKATLGYKLNLDKHKTLRFGMSIGAGHSGVNLNLLDDVPLDKTLTSLSSNSYIIADFGASIRAYDFEFGLAFPHLIGRDLLSHSSFAPLKFGMFDNITLTGSYTYQLGFVNYKPMFLYRFSPKGLSQIELTNLFYFKQELIWAGATFRQDYGFSGLLGIKAKENLSFGFSYELGNNQLNQNTSGTIEASILFVMGQSRSKVDDQKNSKLSRSEAIAERRRLAQERLAARAASEKMKVETKDTVRIEKVAVVTQKVKPVSKLDTNAKLLERVDENGEREIGMTYLVTNADNTTSKVVKWRHHEEPHEEGAPLPKGTFKRGSHFLELPVGHHVVAANFKDFQAAEDYSDKLFERGFHGTIVGYVSALKEYFVVVHKGATMKQAEEEQRIWSKRKDLDHVYIMNVVH